MTDIEIHQPGALEQRTPEAEHLNLLWKLARMTTDTEMVPRQLRGRPDAALAVMVYGHELGLRPMSSLREIYIIEGTPSCSAKLMRATVLRAGHKIEFREATRERCVMYGERKDGTGSSLVEYTIEDAKIAGLTGKNNWKSHPRAMLKARATSELVRDIFADVTIGYTPEELSRVDLAGEYDFVDVETVDQPLEAEAATTRPAPVDEDGVIHDAELWDVDGGPAEPAEPILPLDQ